MVLNYTNYTDYILNLISTITKFLGKLFNSFYKLRLLDKVFILLLILAFSYIIVNNFKKRDPEYYGLEGFDNGIESDDINLHSTSEKSKKINFVKKSDSDIYDNYYAKFYDSIFPNTTRSNFEIGKIVSLEKKNNYTKLLDIGCGTGYTVKTLADKNYDIIGIDKSHAMINRSSDKYPECNFVEGDIINNNLFDYGVFTHITCLGKTIYEIKDKETFFENCYSLLAEGGYLIVHLVNRDKFNPYVKNSKSKIIFDPEKYGKKIDQIIVKFDKNTEFMSNFKKFGSGSGSGPSNNENSEENMANIDETNLLDDDVSPFMAYNHKFKNYSTNNVRKYENNLYMPETAKILNLAESKKFELHNKFNMDSINYANEYLYVFRK